MPRGPAPLIRRPFDACLRATEPSPVATKWTLIPAGPVATEIASAAVPGSCVTVPPSGTTLVTGPCAATPAATWHIE